MGHGHVTVRNNRLQRAVTEEAAAGTRYNFPHHTKFARASLCRAGSAVGRGGEPEARPVGRRPPPWPPRRPSGEPPESDRAEPLRGGGGRGRGSGTRHWHFRAVGSPALAGNSNRDSF
jgi:hypothetical protein